MAKELNAEMNSLAERTKILEKVFQGFEDTLPPPSLPKYLPYPGR